MNTGSHLYSKIEPTRKEEEMATISLLFVHREIERKKNFKGEEVGKANRVNSFGKVKSAKWV